MSVLAVTSSAQGPAFKDDLKKVVASSVIQENVYSNEHVGFRLVLPESPCDPKLNTTVDLQHSSAILLTCNHVVQGWKGMYTLEVLIDYRGNYPLLRNIDQYVRSWRHIAERQHEKAVQTEQARRMAGMDFVESILSKELPTGGTFYDGIACTQLREYLLCFLATAPTVDEIRSVPDLERRFSVSTKPATK